MNLSEQKHPRYFLDIALIYPAIIGLMQLGYAMSSWPPTTWTAKGIWMGLGTLSLCLIFAKEKAITFAAAFGFMAVMGLVGVPLRASSHSTSEIVLALFASVGAGVAAALLVVWRGRGPAFYRSERPWTDRLVIVLAIILTLVFFLTPLRTLYFENLSK